MNCLLIKKIFLFGTLARLVLGRDVEIWLQGFTDMNVSSVWFCRGDEAGVDQGNYSASGSELRFRDFQTPLCVHFWLRELS